MSDEFDMSRFASDLAQVQGRMVKAAVQGERNYTHPYLNAIFKAFDLAEKDANARIPSPLMAAITAARRALGECAPAHSFEDRRKYPRTQHASDIEHAPDGRMYHPGQ